MRILGGMGRFDVPGKSNRGKKKLAKSYVKSLNKLLLGLMFMAVLFMLWIMFSVR